MYSPAYLRALQAAILASPQCAPYVHDNAAPRISGAEVYAKDAAIADILNAAGWGAASQPVPVHLAKDLLIKRGRWRRIVQASANDAHPAVDAAFAFVALAEDDRLRADFLVASDARMLAELLAHELIGSADRGALEDLCRTPSALTAAEVSRALRGPWGDE